MLVLHPEVRFTLTQVDTPPEFVNEYLSNRRVWPGVDVPGHALGPAQLLAMPSRNIRDPDQLESPAAMLPETVVVGAAHVGMVNGKAWLPPAELTVRVKSIGVPHTKPGAVLTS